MSAGLEGREGRYRRGPHRDGWGEARASRRWSADEGNALRRSRMAGSIWEGALDTPPSKEDAVRGQLCRMRRNAVKAALRAVLLSVAAAAILLVGAGTARATITFDPDTGTGFVPKANMPYGWFSGSKGEQLKRAKQLYFWYRFYHEEEYALTCSWGPGTAYIMYRTHYDLRETLVKENGTVVGWTLSGRDGDARTSVTNTLEWPGFETCTVDRLTATYDFVRLYVDLANGGPPIAIWQQGEGVCFLASAGDPSAC